LPKPDFQLEMKPNLPTPIDFRTCDGLTLRADAWGDPKRPAVLFQHGGGQTRHAWGGTARALAELGWYAVTLDLRGHGDSDWSPDADYNLDSYSRDTLRVLRTFPRPPAVVGASLGGLSALVAQSLEPELFSSLVLVDITPRMQPEGVARIGAFMKKYLEHGFASLEEAADAVAAYLPNRPRRQDLSGLEKNLRRGEDGRYRWHWDPRFLTGERSPGSEPLQDRLLDATRALHMPTLLVRGRMSDIVSEDTAREFLDMVPHAAFADVSEAGHMVAGDRNDAFTDAVVEFLRGL
jgi:pimeloyl-ACP methyl ester carboxylesterase